MPAFSDLGDQGGPFRRVGCDLVIRGFQHWWREICRKVPELFEGLGLEGGFHAAEIGPVDGQFSHEARMPDRHSEGDDAAHAVSEEVGAFDLQLLEEGRRVVRHLLDA